MGDAARLLLFLRRAMHLRCPECGISPIFVPLRQMRRPDDFLHPLDGCPRCGYAYTRENGYWLLATWVINYTLVAGVGLTAGILIDSYLAWPLWKTCVVVFTPMPLLSLALARHAKSVFLAVDHYCDPHLPSPGHPREG
jgi:uncharacterized protein (DUF983 family)